MMFKKNSTLAGPWTMVFLIATVVLTLIAESVIKLFF